MASSEDSAHANNLEYTLKELRREIRDREQQLNNVCHPIIVSISLLNKS